MHGQARAPSWSRAPELRGWCGHALAATVTRLWTGALCGRSALRPVRCNTAVHVGCAKCA
eukprot:14171135-Alexandrium_andersonii.AAC.1